MRTLLGTAIALAATAHEHQSDKAGKAYILHPLRMMMRLRTDDEELMAIAILHDVVEDCGMTPHILKEDYGMTDRVIHGVMALSKRAGERYLEDFIPRCAQNEDARRVKLEDLRDNSDITRLKGISEKDIERAKKYHEAFMYLKNYRR